VSGGGARVESARGFLADVAANEVGGWTISKNCNAVKKAADKIEPGWYWGTPEGSREFDRLVDRNMTFRETLEWLEEA